MRFSTLFLAATALWLTTAAGTLAADPLLDSRFTIGRLHYSGGGDWYANPSSLTNLLRELSSRTTLRAARKEATVTLRSNDVFSYPFLFATGHGNISFSAEEADRLRRYLTSGGFWWVDDNYGMDESLRPALKKLFPDKQLVELPRDHEIYRCFYTLTAGLPKIHEHHGGPPHGYALFHEGRMIVYYSYNTDLGDGLEDPDVHRDPPAKREAALQMALNVVVYALTH
ncbi:MAG: DUF4159 domain-containing protein [Candidatus Riflebacteria bacterium]|nr:DUF4159 domain-containing protein [Candidatus Riflebacteria bacterium]